MFIAMSPTPTNPHLLIPLSTLLLPSTRVLSQSAAPTPALPKRTAAQKAGDHVDREPVLVPAGHVAPDAGRLVGRRLEERLLHPGESARLGLPNLGRGFALKLTPGRSEATWP